MDIYRVGVDLKFVNKLGETLSTEEKYPTLPQNPKNPFYRNHLNVGLMRIMKTEKIDQLMFWGRIRGMQKDYYIAIGLQFLDQYEFPAKRFYWA
jgi:radial spoke head protein 9